MQIQDAQPKTFAEFEKYRQELFAKSHAVDAANPFSFAIERNNHEIQRLQELIRVAEGVEGVTIKSRIAGWKRQLQKRISARERFRILARDVEDSLKNPSASKQRF